MLLGTTLCGDAALSEVGGMFHRAVTMPAVMLGRAAPAAWWEVGLEQQAAGTMVLSGPNSSQAGCSSYSSTACLCSRWTAPSM